MQENENHVEQVQLEKVKSLKSTATLDTAKQSNSVGQNPVGKWETVDFIRHIEDFKPSVKFWNGDKFIFDRLNFYEDGTTSGPWKWKKDYLWHPGDKTRARYVIKEIDSETYLFIEHMSGDVTIRGQKPSYYVLQKR